MNAWLAYGGGEQLLLAAERQRVDVHGGRLRDHLQPGLRQLR